MDLLEKANPWRQRTAEIGPRWGWGGRETSEQSTEGLWGRENPPCDAVIDTRRHTRVRIRGTASVTLTCATDSGAVRRVSAGSSSVKHMRSGDHGLGDTHVGRGMRENSTSRPQLSVTLKLL